MWERRGKQVRNVNKILEAGKQVVKWCSRIGDTRYSESKDARVKKELSGKSIEEAVGWQNHLFPWQHVAHKRWK